jgi:hypothetical protein
MHDPSAILQVRQESAFFDFAERLATAPVCSFIFPLPIGTFAV